MRTALHSLNTNQLRDLAVEMGADRKTLYGTSKQALILKVQKLSEEFTRKQNLIREYREGIAALAEATEGPALELKKAYETELARLTA